MRLGWSNPCARPDAGSGPLCPENAGPYGELFGPLGRISVLIFGLSVSRFYPDFMRAVSATGVAAETKARSSARWRYHRLLR